jgi:hypothetical protein
MIKTRSKMKKRKKIKTKPLIEEPPKKKRGRPRKEKVTAAPKKRGRPKKVVETKQEKIRKVAKLGKRKYKQAIEDMAMEKINKKLNHKRNGNDNGIADVISSRTFSYERYSKTAASPTVPPVGIDPKEEKSAAKNETHAASIEENIKRRLSDKGYAWKVSSFKVVEKTPTHWVVEFTDKKQGFITSYNNVENTKKEQVVDEKAAKKEKQKVPKLPKVELNRYIKQLVTRGYKPTNVKVIENTPTFFRVEFNDGKDGVLTALGHVKKGWEL